jgi:hypothetical protein
MQHPDQRSEPRLYVTQCRGIELQLAGGVGFRVNREHVVAFLGGYRHTGAGNCRLNEQPEQGRLLAYRCVHRIQSDARCLSDLTLHQQAIRTLNRSLPAVGAFTSLVTVAAAVLVRDNQTRFWLLIVAFVCFLAAGLITQFRNQRINALVSDSLGRGA